MKKFFLVLLVSLPIAVSGQGFQQEMRFTNHLINKKYFDEAIYHLNTLLKKRNSAIQNDSINFLLGRSYYQLQQLDSSIVRFDKVSSSLQPLQSEAVFFSAFNEAYLKRFKNSQLKLSTFYPQDTTLISLKIFEMGGLSLLQRNLKAFDSLNLLISQPSFIYGKQQEKMVYFSKVLRKKPKSPATAAILSGFIPGAGKIYAGYKGQGIFNFIVAGLLGLQTWEGYKKDGPQSFRFIAYGTLFTGFYISNIWGSSLAVKIKQREINNSIDDQILFDMHIPLRSAFR